MSRLIVDTAKCVANNLHRRKDGAIVKQDKIFGKLFKMKIVLTVSALLVLIFSYSPAYGQDGDDGGWQFSLVPYFWAAGLEGDAAIKGQQQSVDASFGDILENFDIGGMIYIEARKDKLGFFVNPLYMKLSAGGAVGPFSTTAEIVSELTIIEFGALYRLAEGEAWSFDVLAGGRYFNVTAEVDVFFPIIGVAIDVDKSRDWIDPIVGGRYKRDLTEKLSFLISGDIGGFDVGNSSELTWNILSVLGYNFSPKTTLWFGYRHFDIDYEDGSGSDLFALDVAFSGPIVGLQWRF